MAKTFNNVFLAGKFLSVRSDTSVSFSQKTHQKELKMRICELATGHKYRVDC